MTNSADLESTPSTLKSVGLLTLIQNVWEKLYLTKLGIFATSLFLFILAIILMKEGSRGLAPLLQNQFTLNNAANSLGFGWLFAYVIMSGSPVAAAALTFYDAG